MSTAKLFSEQYFGMADRNSTDGKNIAHGRSPDGEGMTVPGEDRQSFVDVRYLFHTLKVMPDEASVRQDSLRQDSLRQRVAYRAPGFECSCAQNGRKPH